MLAAKKSSFHLLDSLESTPCPEEGPRGTDESDPECESKSVHILHAFGTGSRVGGRRRDTSRQELIPESTGQPTEELLITEATALYSGQDLEQAGAKILRQQKLNITHCELEFFLAELSTLDSAGALCDPSGAALLFGNLGHLAIRDTEGPRTLRPQEN